MTLPEMLPLLNLDEGIPPWDGEFREIQGIVMVNREPVRVRVLGVYTYWSRQMVTVQALRGEPFPHTNTWYHTWYSDTRHTHLAFLQEVTLVY